MSSLDRYKKVFIEVFNVAEEQLDDSFNFADVEEWDSFTHLTLINELEAEFDVLFETEDILHYGGYLNGIEILKKYGVDFED